MSATEHFRRAIRVLMDACSSASPPPGSTAVRFVRHVRPSGRIADSFLTSAAAQAAGFRACLRCRPEISPELACWRGTSKTVSRALALIAEGFLDREDGTVEALATRVGMGERQLRRLFERHLGASPVAVAQTRRLLFAKQLIHDTRLSMAEVAMAGGFGSLRRFNDAFRTLYHRPPRELRRRNMRSTSDSPAVAPVMLHISYRPPS